jgi:hypothetical protein
MSKFATSAVMAAVGLVLQGSAQTQVKPWLRRRT